MKNSFVHVHLIALRYFGETVRAGSMRKAAEQLNVAGSAVNRQIIKLEDQLQCKLFDRLADGVHLTAAGEVLYNYTKRLDSELERAISQIDNLRGLRRGRVRLACEDGIGRDFLPQVLVEFHEQHPGIIYTVDIASAQEVLDQVAEGQVDLGIAMTPPTRSDVAILAQAEMPLGVIMAPDHQLAQQPRIHLKDVMGERLIEARDGSGGTPEFYERLGHGFPRSRFMETNSFDFVTNLVRTGLGVGIRTPVGILNLIETGRIAFVPVADRHTTPRLTVFGNRQRAPSIAGAVLAEMIKDKLPAFERHVGEVVAAGK